jgi:hypothetical protein
MLPPKRIRNYAVGPEAKIQKQIIDYLQMRGWMVCILHANAHQSGLPDLFIARRGLGSRFVEVKQPKKYVFTEAQCEVFSKFAANDVGIWILTSATEHEYKKLFNVCNWWAYFEPTKMRSPKLVKKPPEAIGPEADIQRAVIEALEKDGWFVKVIHCDMYQVGLPDILACKRGEGIRWVEIKNPKHYRFTAGQFETFPRLAAEGVGVWILTSSDQLELLNGPANWWEFMYGNKGAT